MSFIKRFIKSVYKFDEYGELVSLSLGSTLFYYLIISVICAAVMCFAAAPILSQIIETAKNNTPEFSIEGGKLVMDDAFSFQDYGLSVIMDPNCEDVNKLVDGESALSGIFVGKNSLLIKNSFIGSEEVTDLSALEGFSSDDVGVFLQLMKTLSYIIIVVGFLILRLMLMIFAWCLAKLMSNIFGGGLGMKNSLKLGIYAMTLPVVLKTVFYFTSFALPNLIFYALIIVYIYFGIKCCKTAEAKA